MEEFFSRGGLWLLLFLLVVGVHLVWVYQDDRPAIWDMAYHQYLGWIFLETLESKGFSLELLEQSGRYPPLFYLQEAILIWLGFEQSLPVMANVLGLFLLSFSTYRLALLSGHPVTAQLVGVLSLLFPMVVWMSRGCMLDLSLAGWVALGALGIAKSDDFQKRSWTLLFGAISLAGVLTKWTYPVYLLGPVLWTIVKSSDKRRSLLNLADAAIVTLPVAFLWYLPHLSRLTTDYGYGMQQSWIPWNADPRNGEPGLSSILGWVYYPRALASYFLFLPLTLIFIFGWVREWRRRDSQARFLWVWFLSTNLFLIFMTPKDPRFAIPLAAPLALLLMYPLRRRSRWLVLIFSLGLIQFFSVSFAWAGPVKWAWFERQPDPDYQNIQRELVLYANNYAQLLGPPQRQDWYYGEILDRLPDQSSVAWVPDAPYFHPIALSLEGIRRGMRVEVRRVGERLESLFALGEVDYAVTKTKGQGLSFITKFNAQAAERLLVLRFSEIGSWGLPDGSRAILWKAPQTGEAGPESKD